ncbi:AsmA family protein [Beggiatoa leptomitoformis]|uniref:AsmA family protein n=1 Tax=Beggiatoa leptomitoformis TaxID=288004 RepID=A0A2N9YGU5_9GAMM|nr:AsmA family protein [Beggiatoa leptomitoformis]ALG67945.1 AsmA family protein [Beggiatoa leptomitoformis]AUI69781.1 AsmA family protein [Beggiatoa leptomitoformis]
MKILKIIGVVFLVLLFSIIVASQLINPNDYKSTLAEMVKTATGRTLYIEGDISISLLPRISITMGKTWLSNAENFDKIAFISIENTEIRLQILPLLMKRIVLEKVLLSGVNLNLQRNILGQGNWEDLSNKSATTDNTASNSFSIEIQQTTLQQAQIHWDDVQQQQHYSATNLNIDMGTLAYPLNQQVLPLHLASQLLSTNLKTEIALNTQIQLTPTKQQYRLNPLTMTLTATGQAIPNQQQTLRINTQLFVDIAQQQLAIDTLQINLLDNINIQLQLNTQNLLTNPHLTGKLTVPSFAPQIALKQLGININNSDKLQSINASAEIDATLQDKVSLNNINIQLDKHTLTIPQIQLDINTQQLQMVNFVLQIANLNATAVLTIQQLFTNPLFIGELIVKPFSLKEFLQTFDFTIPELAYLPLKTAALRLAVNGTREALKVDLQGIIDDNNASINNLQINVPAKTATLEQSVLSAFGLRLTGQANFTQWTTQPVLLGTIQLASFSPRELLKKLNISPPSTRDAKALDAAELSLQVKSDLHSVQLTDINLRVDQSRLRGYINVSAWQPLIGKLALQVDDIDADRYLAPTQTANNKSTNTILPDLPWAEIQATNLQGTIMIDTLKMNDIIVKDTAIVIE